MYDTAHKSDRVKIENAFGVLKGRWRCLRVGLRCHLPQATNMVLACMVLHNVCIQRKDEWSPDIADESAYEDPDRGLQRPAWMEDDDPERAPAPVPTAEERASMEGKEAERVREQVMRSIAPKLAAQYDAARRV